jgi:hypothetical protein
MNLLLVDEFKKTPLAVLALKLLAIKVFELEDLRKSP